MCVLRYICGLRTWQDVLVQVAQDTDGGGDENNSWRYAARQDGGRGERGRAEELKSENQRSNTHHPSRGRP